MAAYQRQSRRFSLALIITIIIVAVLGIILVLVLSGQPSPPGARSVPQPVNDRVVQNLQRNDMQALYEEMSPSLKEIFALDQLIAGEQSVSAAQGRITRVEVLEAPTIKTGPEWNGEWADAKVQITRGTTMETYVVRYHLENGQWWFFGTIKVQ